MVLRRLDNLADTADTPVGTEAGTEVQVALKCTRQAARTLPPQLAGADRRLPACCRSSLTSHTSTRKAVGSARVGVGEGRRVAKFLH